MIIPRNLSPPMITMLITRTLANWKGSGKYNWSWDVVIYPPVWYSWRTWNVNRPARFCLVKRFKSFLMSLSVVTDGSCFLRAQFPSIHRRFFKEITPNKEFIVLRVKQPRRTKEETATALIWSTTKALNVQQNPGRFLCATSHMKGVGCST